MQAQIRLQAAEMHLAALQTEYCNANWAFSQKIKELREALAQRDTKHNHLQVQLAALKSSFAEHKAEVSWAVCEMTKIQASESPAKQSLNCTKIQSQKLCQKAVLQNNLAEWQVTRTYFQLNHYLCNFPTHQTQQRQDQRKSIRRAHNSRNEMQEQLSHHKELAWAEPTAIDDLPKPSIENNNQSKQAQPKKHNPHPPKNP